MNKQVCKLIGEVAYEQLDADEDYRAALEKCNSAVARLSKAHGMSDDLHVLEDAIFEGMRQMERVLLPLALNVGRNPDMILDLPDSNL